MTDHAIADDSRAPAWRAAFPWLVAAAVYAMLQLLGQRLLNDPDSYWHLVVGQQILATWSFPHADTYSHTMAGAPWIAKEWLSQVLYATAYALGGWTAVVAAAAAAIALAFGLLAKNLLEELDMVPAFVLVIAAFVLASPHLVARPHALALPVMVTFVAGVVRAADRGRAPSLWLLPLITAWANLHGGFTLGLALIVPLAAEAVWKASTAERRQAALQWGRFALLALLAACVTPYGPESILMTWRILGLGEALSLIIEWQPQDFSRLAGFELCLLAALGFALHRGLTLPPVRLLIVLGLLHLALAHVRNAEVLGLLGPLFIAAALARQLPELARHRDALSAQPTRVVPGGLAVLAAALTLVLATTRPLAPGPEITPVAAIEAIKRAKAGPVLNDYPFGAYMVRAGIAPFIDGRTELYGGPFTVRHHRAVMLQSLPDLLLLLQHHKIDATLLHPATPAVALLDRLPEWKRIHIDAFAVAHQRVSPAP